MTLNLDTIEVPSNVSLDQIKQHLEKIKQGIS